MRRGHTSALSFKYGTVASRLILCCVCLSILYEILLGDDVVLLGHMWYRHFFCERIQLRE
jgi:hypothetical protein